MTAKSNNFDFNEAFTHFFTQKDWKERAVWISAVYGGINLIYLLSSFLVSIPVIGLICLPVLCLALPAFILASFWFTGYTVEVAEKTVEHKHFELSPLKQDLRVRMMEGFKVFVGGLVYAIPFILSIVITIAVFIIAVGILDSNSDNNSGLTALGVILLIIALFFFILIFIFYFLMLAAWPAIIRQYIKFKTIQSMLKLGEIYNYIRMNLGNVVIVSGIFLLFSFAFGMLISFAQLSIFLCIGLVLYPIAAGLGTLYMMDVYGILIGQMIKIEKTEKVS